MRNERYSLTSDNVLLFPIGENVHCHLSSAKIDGDKLVITHGNTNPPKFLRKRFFYDELDLSKDIYDIQLFCNVLGITYTNNSEELVELIMRQKGKEYYIKTCLTLVPNKNRQYTIGRGSYPAYSTTENLSYTWSDIENKNVLI